MYNYGCSFYYSKDLVTWKSIYGTFIYNPNNKHYYKVAATHSGDNYVVTITEMTSLNVYGSAVTIDSIAYNAYSYSSFYNAYKLGNYYVMPYSLESDTKIGSGGTENGYQRIAYTQDFNTWKLVTIYSETEVSYARTQMTILGSSGSVLSLFSATSSGFRPVSFTSPTKYTNHSVLWSAGNMTAATGFYCNGTWHYCDWGSYTTYLSTNGASYTKCSSDYWRNPYMIFTQNHYITSHVSTGILRVYDSSFSDYEEVFIPCPEVTRILGLMDNKLYIQGSDGYMYRTDIGNLIS
jgi:hypothetical protein